ncbi:MULTISPECIES: hypothetical protein [Clostridium]|uniref:Uncharacterized protein n=2 Tax=Clostridium TaxID=1485 RepID=D8GMZ5_CLOLD|nr:MULTISPECIES: hypothetical protein [Clostridium]ADK15783.1 conserved hypothetical protein [Clostridium ljungdahlii DSM 13528]AGY75038.1 hypothetical protein CAETHG_0811 [Clostridium autoethanogenum DSM 10061]ALU35212.1 Hypothetical protein CLAU_0783 [Clostridium autoethanogenum DSM 10061]OAA86414.1 hypothetical protein WX45_04078 [Clostridium ljungdahlii DSM 13528]OVY49287.1 hypothetical protein WX72_03637 [Clostridium autoethanogenum]
MHNRQFPYCPYYMNQAVKPFFKAKVRNKTQKFAAFSGTVTRIEDFSPSPSDVSEGCYKLMSLESKDKGPVNFVISPETYFVDHEVVEVGDKVTGFYDANAPAILIYPPQYPAIVIAKNIGYQNVTVDYFNNQLISSDGNLKLNITLSTKVILTNDQLFNRYPGNRNLIVVYGPTTMSIPAQTTPYKIIVLC